MVRVKRVYEKAEAKDGWRVLVDRLWPRGMKKEAAKIDQTMNQEIIFARLCTGFAILALVIACVGLYGTMAYTVVETFGGVVLVKAFWRKL